MRALQAVFNETKLINLKAIHNTTLTLRKYSSAVFNETKLINLKAIHN